MLLVFLHFLIVILDIHWANRAYPHHLLLFSSHSLRKGSSSGLLGTSGGRRKCRFCCCFCSIVLSSTSLVCSAASSLASMSAAFCWVGLLQNSLDIWLWHPWCKGLFHWRLRQVQDGKCWCITQPFALTNNVLNLLTFSVLCWWPEQLAEFYEQELASQSEIHSAVTFSFPPVPSIESWSAFTALSECNMYSTLAASFL